MTTEDVIAVFPLPNVVFFPKTNLPLHIFEPRYCEMVQDSVMHHQLIGMFLLQPGWQEQYYGNPPIHQVGCAGELVSVENLPEEKFNIVLRGLYRARVLEVVQEHPYRKARIEVVQDIYSRKKGEMERLRKDLLAEFAKMLKLVKEQGIQSLRKSDVEEVVHSLATVLQLDVDVKQRLLGENDLFIRGQLVHDFLKKHVSVLEWTSHFAHLRPADPSQN